VQQGLQFERTWTHAQPDVQEGISVVSPNFFGLLAAHRPKAMGLKNQEQVAAGCASVFFVPA
jgi:hypothetical protein